MPRQQLTVEQLIEKLQALPDKTMLVKLEGCDCFGDLADVHIDLFELDQPRVVLTRTDSYYYE